MIKTYWELLENNMGAEEQDKVKEVVTEFLEEAGVTKEEIKATEDSLEDKARLKGWRPDGPKSAKEFLDDEPFYEERRAKNKTIKDLEKAITDMKDQLDRRERIGYQKALAELKQRRSDAIAIGDEQAVNEVDNEIGEIQSNLPQETNILENPVVKDFADRNANWLKDRSKLEHIRMQEYFIQQDADFKKYALPVEDHTRLVEQSMHEKFPNYFDNIEENGSMVGNTYDAVPTGAVKRKKSYSFNDLTSEQKDVCRRLIRRCGMTEQEYVDSLVKSGDLR